MKLLLCFFYLHLALSSSSSFPSFSYDGKKLISAEMELARAELWADFISDPEKQKIDVLQQLPLNYQTTLNQMIVDSELDQNTRMHVIELLLGAGADLRKAFTEGLRRCEVEISDDQLYYEFFSSALSAVGPLLGPQHIELDLEATLYECLREFHATEEFFLKVFFLIARFEPLAPLETEMTLHFPLSKCDEHVNFKTRILQAYLDHPNNLPIYNCMLVFAWSQNFCHYRLDGHELIPTNNRWFELVKPCLMAGKKVEAVNYILQCRRMGASLVERYASVAVWPSRKRTVVTYKPVLRFAAEDLPVKFRDLIILLIIPARFPKNRLGEPAVSNSDDIVFGLEKVDALVADGSCSFRQLIMRARNVRAKHTAFIEAMIGFAGEQQTVYLEATIGVLMAMIALETGQWIA